MSQFRFQIVVENDDFAVISGGGILKIFEIEQMLDIFFYDVPVDLRR